MRNRPPDRDGRTIPADATMRPYDMPAPGTHGVSFGGRIGYLNATVCSNTAEVIVEK